MDVEAVVSVVIHKVTDLLIQDAIIFDKVIDQVEHIRVELRQMRGFLMDAEDHPDEDAKKWVKDYLKTSYHVEDIIESYVLKLAHKKPKMGLFKSYGLFFHDWPACWSLLRKMKHIEVNIEELKKKKPAHVEDASLRFPSQEDNLPDLDQINFDDYQESYSVYTGYNFRQTKRVPSSITEEEDSDFIGFKEHAKKLMDLLSRNGGERIISVVGDRGSGKTTLVRRVYNHKSKMQFDCQAWINVSEEHAVKDLLLGIWNQVNKKKRDREIAALDDSQLKVKLVEFLQGHQYLIVLDDAREKPGAWKDLMNAFPDMGNGSKVLLISHQEATTDYLKGEILCLQSLGDKEGWELFKRILCPQGESNLFQQTTLQKRILDKCKGLPLNITLLAGLLTTKRVSCGEWTQLFNQANWHSSEVWLLSYNDLPENYKLCLLYMALFPKEFDISVRRILRLWVAEGFIRRSKGGAEDSAEECFNYLVSRNLIKICKFRTDGGPKKCVLPGFLREEFFHRAQEISLFFVYNKKIPEDKTTPENGVRRIVEYADIKDYAPNSTSNSPLIKNLRSYLSFNFPRYDSPAQQVGNFLRKIIGNKGYGMLRVLDLEGVYKPILPPTLKHLLQLRYLGLRWTFLDILPKSVGDLPYLETLDLKRTYVKDLPSSVWKLQHLRHLYLPQVQLNMDMQQPSSQLITLWGLIINDEHNMEDGLARLHDLRELGITCQLKNFEALNNWITRLNRLQSLSVTSKDDKGRPSKLCLDQLSELGELSHLKLLGKLSQLFTKDQFPPYLKVLTLSVSNLFKDPMPTLSQLPCLVVLRLLAKSYLGQEMHCPENGFGNLCTLKLWMLEELDEWIVQEGGMPCIRKLNIRHCHKLKEIPSELLKRDTLEELILDDMPNLGNDISNHKQPHTILKINSYTFSPLPWEKDGKDLQLWPQEDDQVSSLQET